MEELERLVDQYGLHRVTDWLADICAQKAEHIRHNWQDEKMARLWEKDSNTFNRALNRLENQ
jgi:hypothetical protein